MLSRFSHVLLFVTPWTVAHQAPLSMGFSRQEYWSGLPYLPPGDLPDPGIDLASLTSAALAGGFFTASAIVHMNWLQIQGQVVSVTWKGETLSPTCATLDTWSHHLKLDS